MLLISIWLWKTQYVQLSTSPVVRCPQWLWHAALAGAHHMERDGAHLSCGRNMENKPVCHSGLITDSNVSAEGAFTVAWEHHLPVSNVLHIISLPPLVSSLLFSWYETVMKVAQKQGSWELACLLSSNNKSPSPATRSPPKTKALNLLSVICLVC